MTYRTFDIDAGNTGTTAVSTAPARHTRRRRHALVMGHHTSGSRVSGFGI